MTNENSSNISINTSIQQSSESADFSINSTSINSTFSPNQTSLNTNMQIQSNEYDSEFALETTTANASFTLDQLESIDATFCVGATADKTYVHEQGIASSEWTVTHNLDKFPSVTVVDSAQTIITAKVVYINKNTCKIYMNSPFKGRAYFN